MAHSPSSQIFVGNKVVFKRDCLSLKKRQKLEKMFGGMKRWQYVEQIDPIPEDLQRRMKNMYGHESSVWIRIRDLDGNLHCFPDVMLKKMSE